VNDRSRAIFIALIVQLIVSVALFPWSASIEKEFYSGAKMALVIGVLANVVTRLVMMQWVPIASAWYLLIGFAFAMISAGAAVALADSGLVAPSAASLGCVVLQQIGFATIAFHVQQRATESRISRAGILLAIAGMASFFAVAVPSLLRRIDIRQVSPNEVTDLVFAAPVILIALIGIMRRPAR